MRFIPLLAAVALASTPMSSAAQTPEQEAAIVGAFLQFDCVMTRENEDSVVAAMGLSDDESEAAGQAMFEAGRFQQVNDTLVLQHPDCPGGGDVQTPSGPAAATAWMQSLSPAQAADVLAEIMAANGCGVADEAFGLFQQQVSNSIAARFGFDLGSLLPDQMDPFLDALDDLGESGANELLREGRLIDGPDGVTLVACQGADASVGGAQSGPDLMHRLLELDREDVAAIEAATLAEIGCRVSPDMGFNFTAMVFDRIMASVEFDLGPAGALDVMGHARLAQPYRGENAEELTYASGLVNDAFNAMVRDGRLQAQGTMLVAEACTPTSPLPNALLPYLTGQP